MYQSFTIAVVRDFLFHKFSQPEAISENRACTNFHLLLPAEGTPIYEQKELR